MSTIQTANLKNAASASNNIVLDASGNATFAGTAAMASSFLRNRIINGDMRIDQRNAGASVTPASGAVTYTVDRAAIFVNQASKLTAQRSTVAPSNFTNSLLITSSSAFSPGSTDLFNLFQAIEGFNVADLGWGTANAQTVTLSFWVRASVTGTYAGSLSNGGNTRWYVFNFSVSAANTWEYKTITIPGDTTGTWLTDNGIGLHVRFNLGAGSTLIGTAGSWGGTTAYTTSGAVNVVATNGATFHLTGVQLEVGTVATPFERRQFGQELALCQRYYEKSYDQTVVPGTASSYPGSSWGARVLGGWTNQGIYKVTKRATPTVTTYSPQNGTAGTIRNEGVGGDETSTVDANGVTSFRAFGTSTNTPVLFSMQWVAAAEL